MKNTADNLINILAAQISARSYLEIGVREGDTFFNVDILHKTAVDPNFQFDPEEHKEENISFFPITSDEFFENFPEEQKKEPYNREDSDFTFDIIYIDGMHTYEQAYKDFTNSLRFSHEKTVWIFDDTLPWDPLSAYPNQETSLKYRKLMGLAGRQWHGDVFKAIVAIHEFNQDFSYATHIDSGNPQTIVWRGQGTRVCIGGEEAIDKFDVYTLYDNASVLNPMKQRDILPLIGTAIDDKDFHTADPSEIVWQAKTFREIDLSQTSCHVDQLSEQFAASIKDLKNVNSSQSSNLKKIIDQKNKEIVELTRKIKIQTDLLETKRRNIVRHIRSAVMKASIFLAACIGTSVAIIKYL